jgi:SnoaL-like domain
LAPYVEHSAARSAARLTGIHRPPVERCTAVERLLVRFYDALRDPQQDAVAGLFVSDAETLFVGTDPAEWFTGAESIVSELSTMLSDTGGIDLIQTDPRAHQQGPTAWVADQPLFLLPDGAQIPVRVTATACVIDEEWRFVQMHLSLGINTDLPPEVVAITSRPIE